MNHRKIITFYYIKKMGYTVVCGNEVFREYGYPALWHIRNTQERGRSDGMRKLS